MSATATDKRLRPADRVYTALARHVDRRVLALVPSQRVLRVLFHLSARLGASRPRGLHLRRDADGTLNLRPAGVAEEAPLLLYIHGGGFTIGSPETHAALAGRLAQAAGMRALMPPYPLAPEHPYPAAQEALFARYAALTADGTAPAAICGDSAGGCLALQIALHARDAGLPMPRALGLIAPAADLSGDLEDRFAAAPDEVLIPAAWARRIEALYLPDRDRSDPAISPALADLTGLPPTLLHAAEGEVLARDAKLLAAKLPQATLDLWPGLAHVWHIHTGRMPAADSALDAMGAWLKARAAGPR